MNILNLVINLIIFGLLFSVVAVAIVFFVKWAFIVLSDNIHNLQMRHHKHA